MNIEIKLANIEDCFMIKELDDLCFGSHQGISIKEIVNVIENGAIFLLFIEDELIGESQLVLNQFADCHDFPSNSAYAYGTAIHPDHQGKGYGKILADEQEKFSILHKKAVLHFTVRLENYSSLKMRIDSGAKITGYDPFYYGQNIPEDSRLILEKNLKNKNPISYKEDLFIKVNFDKPPEKEKHKEISSLISIGYQGYTINRDGIGFRR